VIGTLDWNTRLLNMTQLGRLLGPELDPPIRGLFVYNANPVATVPEQERVRVGLEREDLFTVVHDQVITDTARYADVLLPATTFLEGWDLTRGYGSYVVSGIRPVIEAAGEARSNMQLFAALGRGMGFDDPAFQWDDETLFRRLAERLEMPGGTPDTDHLAAGGRTRYDFPGDEPIQFGTVAPMTPDGKIHLTPPTLGDRPFEWQAPDNGQPLTLITPASAKLVTSTMGEYNVDVLRVTLNPADAAERGLENNARVKVYNHRGEVHCLLKVSDRVRSGVASMPKGAWQRSSINGKTSVVLCPDDTQVVGDAACFNDARVEVEALSG
jgi:anaerobic selenocysteine-containing dehydrogenase